MKRSSLQPPTREQVRAWQNRPRKALARSSKAIAKIGRKAKRERPALDRFRRMVKAHAYGQCEGYIHEICVDVPHEGAMAHHIWPEDRDCGRHESKRGAWLCATAHNWVHANPEAAACIGLLRPDRFTIRGDRPA